MNAVGPICRASAQVPSPRTIRVVIVDDSVVARRVITRILEEDGRFVVPASYSDAEQALTGLNSVQADIILLDIELPGRSGIECLPEISAAAAGTAIVILSGQHDRSGRMAIEALAGGAREVIGKPAAGHFGASFASLLSDRLFALHNNMDGSSWIGPQSLIQTGPRMMTTTPAAIGIGASTGGIDSLGRFLEALDPALRLPIFVTQHLPPDFIPFLADQLAQRSGIPVCVAEEGMTVTGGRVYLAPGHAHLALQRHSFREVRVALTQAASRHGAYPAVDPMLHSLAEVYGGAACAVILSGMGRDGLSGSEAIIRSGGSVLAQDSASSVVWGMPGAVVNAGFACAICPPADAAAFIGSHRRSVP